MLGNTWTRRFVAATFIAGTASGIVAIAPGTASAAPGCTYAAKRPTSTNLRIADHVVRRGQHDSASISVRSGAGTPHGKVRLHVSGVATYTLTLSNGTARHWLPTHVKPRRYHVTAHYAGTKCYRPSTDHGSYVVKPRRGQVLGEEGSRPRGDKGGAAGNGGGPKQPGASVLGVEATRNAGAALPATGAAGTTELLGLLGAGLVVTGAGAVALNRRRLRRN